MNTHEHMGQVQAVVVVVVVTVSGHDRPGASC